MKGPDRTRAERGGARAERGGAVDSDEALVSVADGVEVPAALARAIELATDRKGRDLLLLDLRGISNATDYFLLVTGTSDTHVKAIADHVIGELKALDTRPLHVEGLRTGRWVLIDFVDFVVHIFHPAAREFYQLERLWGDAPMHSFAGEEA